MADFDPFANQGGPVAWDPEHSSDAKKQAAELDRRLAADSDSAGSGPSTFSAEGSERSADGATDSVSTLNDAESGSDF